MLEGWRSSSSVSVESVLARFLLGGIFGALDWLAVRSGYVSGLVALFAFYLNFKLVTLSKSEKRNKKLVLFTLNQVELDFFVLANALFVFVWVVFGDGTLVNEYVLVCVISLFLLFSLVLV